MREFSRLERARGEIFAFGGRRFGSLDCGVVIGFATSNIGRSRCRECVCWIWFRSRMVVLLHCRRTPMAH